MTRSDDGYGSDGYASDNDGRAIISDALEAALEEITEGRCLVTNSKQPVGGIDIAYVVQPNLGNKSDRVERFLGLKKSELDFDVAGNLFHLRSDLRYSFEGKGWILLPEENDVLAIFRRHSEQGRDKPDYSQTFGNKSRFKYTFVPWELDDFPIWRREQIPKREFNRGYHHPYEDLPPLTSHINPYFVVLNIMMRVANGNIREFPTQYQARLADISNLRSKV